MCVLCGGAMTAGSVRCVVFQSKKYHKGIIVVPSFNTVEQNVLRVTFSSALLTDSKHKEDIPYCIGIPYQATTRERQMPPPMILMIVNGDAGARNGRERKSCERSVSIL